ncbi:helix-turn-helix domain-containing protein [Lactobacillus johnsonii]|uniref:helix-turn-helix domain-containing protein n=1 Tax=Lactobacillus johnsonii TaxID=33959 RepID=UPI003D05436A
MKQVNELYTQTELANKIGVSKGTLSKWLNKNNVSPEIEKGNKKLYKETIIKEYKQAKKADKEEKRASFSTIEYLKNELAKKQAEIDRLNKKLDEKDKQINDYAGQFAKLADQAQQLNLADKPQLVHSGKVVSNEKMETKQETMKNTDETSEKKANKQSWLKKLFKN